MPAPVFLTAAAMTLVPALAASQPPSFSFHSTGAVTADRG